jgi:hypothetical protein
LLVYFYILNLIEYDAIKIVLQLFLSVRQRVFIFKATIAFYI